MELPHYLRAIVAVVVTLLGTASCVIDAEPEDEASAASEAAATSGPDVSSLRVTGLDTRRVIAIGDLHGDLEAARSVLRLAGAIDERGAWAGGRLVVVQTGDLIDRGSQDKQVLDLIQTLSEQARRAGGALISLNGNHEILNVAGDFRTAETSPGGFASFVPDLRGRRTEDRSVQAEGRMARLRALSPGGTYAAQLATRNIAVIVGDTLFVHGGIHTPSQLRRLAGLNADVQAWMRGARRMPSSIDDETSPVWTRRFSQAPSSSQCRSMRAALERIDIRRMVVGHTPQNRINAACDDLVWRIDVGLSAAYGNNTDQVLEIANGRVQVLSR